MYDPTEAANEWASKTSGASQKYAKAIQRTNKNPGALAAAKQDTMRSRVLKSIDDGTWARNVQVPVDQWKQVTSTAGASNLSSGVNKGKSKVASYLAAAAPKYQQLEAEISAMPNATDADRTNRMLRNLEIMRTFKGLGRNR